MVVDNSLSKLQPVVPDQVSGSTKVPLEVGKKLYFYSTPQPEKPDENSSVTATFHHADSRNTGISKVCSPVHGLVCHEHTEENHIVAVIFNPITGESVISPKVLTYFEYDPINKKFKELCLTWSHLGTLQHQVVTLETGKRLLWRKIPCCMMGYASMVFCIIIQT